VPNATGGASAALAELSVAKSFYTAPDDGCAQAWLEWLTRYAAQVRSEARGAERVGEMRAANPKYILRNWMAAQARYAPPPLFILKGLGNCAFPDRLPSLMINLIKNSREQESERG
jgi:hypothetical protein